MTREEEIIKASHLYAKHQQKPFMDGAKWADKTMIDKACEWLKFNYAEFTDNTRLGIKIDELIKDFKQAMEE